MIQTQDEDQIRIHILGDGITAKALRVFVAKTDYVEDVSLEEAMWLVVSPGIPPSHYPKVHIPILSEIEFAYRMFHHPFSTYQPKLVGITGTNGKSSVTHFCSQVSGFPQAGNMGVPLISFVNHPEAYDWLIVELSSYQLYNCHRFFADIAVFTSFSPDHLSWHGSIAAYKQAKLNMIKPSEKQIVLVSKCSENALPELQNIAGVQVLDTPYVSGEASHVLDNIHLSNTILKHIAPQKEPLSLNQAKAYRLAHRLAPVDIKDAKNRLFINDSKATNPESTLAALDAFKRPVVLILSGEDKGLNLDGFFSDVFKRVKALVVFGHLSVVMKPYLERHSQEKTVFFADSLEAAISEALELTGPQEVLLFSPSSSSYDCFTGFEARGEAFEAILKENVCNR